MHYPACIWPDECIQLTKTIRATLNVLIYFVLRPGELVREREVLMKRMVEVTDGLEERSDKEKQALVLEEG